MIKEEYDPTDVDILLVDDTPDNLRILSSLLKEEGYRLRQVTSGERALEAVAASMPDLILLDVHMSGMSGFDVCEALKNQASTADIPIIFVSAQGAAQSKVRGFALGAADYITKPFYTAEVLARVRHQLTIRHLKLVQQIRAERMEHIFTTLPIAMLIWREDGTILQHNPALQSMFNLRDFTNSSMMDFYSNVDDWDKLIERVSKECAVTNHETLLKTASGREFWALISATIIEKDGEVAFFAAINDISDRKIMELQLEKLATTDSLTGILNRRSFAERSQLEFERCSRKSQPVCMLIFDIDYFKHINDSRGHSVGDIALQHLVQVVSENVRPYDLFGRLGGEEFALLLPETSLEQGYQLAERIRHMIATTPLETEKESVVMKVSGGIALWENGMGFDQIFQRADTALFAAKENGRNRIVRLEKT